MAGYGGSLDYDAEAVDNLPTGRDRASLSARRKLWLQADYNGNGIVSLAEVDRLIASVLRIRGVDKMKPVINRAFHAARDIAPPVGDFSVHYLDFHGFRYFLIYLQHYLQLFVLFAKAQQSAGERYSDRRLSFKEFQAAVPMLLKWGVGDADRLKKDPASVFREIDYDGGGAVLFDEFAHWALFNQNEEDGDDDDLQEALEVLRAQKPNLCSKDLKGIKAQRAKYRVDGPISGQGAMRGDKDFAGAYSSAGDGKHYPGGLAGWRASLARSNDAAASGGPKVCECGCGRPAFSRYATCCTHCKGPEGPHARDCVSKGYPACKNSCGRTAFGRFDTCCTHCKGCDGPHARDCAEKVHALDGDFSSLSTPVKRASAEGPDGFGPHSGGRRPGSSARTGGARPSSSSRTGSSVLRGAGGLLLGGPTASDAGPLPPPTPVGTRPPRDRGGDSLCENGCGRARFGKFKTCCTHCKGPDGPHARDCGNKT